MLFVGRVEHDKGVFDLVEIAKELARKGLNDIGFDVCGVGGALDELKRSVAASGLSDRGYFAWSDRSGTISSRGGSAHSGLGTWTISS